jgi:hypothetical protein
MAGLTKVSFDDAGAAVLRNRRPSNEGGTVLWIWRGEGWAVPAIYFAALAAVILGIVRLGPGGAESDFASAHAWPLAAALGLAGGINITPALLAVLAMRPRLRERRLVAVINAA